MQNNICSGKSLKLIFGVSLLSILLGVIPFTANAFDCDSPICLIGFDENLSILYGETTIHNYEGINWVVFYLIVFFSFIILALLVKSFTGMENIDNASFVILSSIIVCILIPIFNGNVGDCDAPLCYFGQPMMDDPYVIFLNGFYNWIIFYFVMFIQIIIFSSTVNIIFVDIFKKNIDEMEKTTNLIFAILLFVMFCISMPVLNNNFNECENAPICYLGGQSPAGYDMDLETFVEKETVETNTVSNLIMFYAMLGIQVCVTIFLIWAICDFRRKNIPKDENITTE